MDLSVIIPVYNEEPSILPLYRRLKEALDEAAYAYEVIFVDDGQPGSNPQGMDYG